MLAVVTSAALRGIDAYLVRVEVELAGGVPMFQTVGLPAEAVRESRDRVLAALRSSGTPLGSVRVTVNLAPADLRKVGSAFDLPIAIALLVASERLRPDHVLGKVFLGELGLDGRLRPGRGVLPMCLAAWREGMKDVVVPEGNAEEAELVRGLRVHGLEDLTAVVNFLEGHVRPLPPERKAGHDAAARAAAGGGDHGAGRGGPESDGPLDLAAIRGQAQARRALEVAAAGGHNMLLAGPPGAGKTLLARALPGILPPLGTEEAVEVTCIHSAAGKLLGGGGLITRAPIRAPHHTVSDAGLVGGGAAPRPGEVSLAHRGVLFLDELPEFRRSVLEALRQPLEERRIAVVRAGGRAVFPCDFMFVAAMNLWPCVALLQRFPRTWEGRRG